MVDLIGQHHSIQKELSEAMDSVISSGKFINGPSVKEFQQSLEKYLNVGAVIPCANGTDALQLSLMSLELPEQSEIIVPSFNYVAGAEVVALLGHKLVFVDVDPKTFNMDINSLEKAITSRTQVIIVVHLFGQSAFIDKILEVARQHNIYVIEDAAQSLGAEFTSGSQTQVKTGTIGDIGTTSFFPTKCLGCMGDGGAVFTNNDQLADRIRGISMHGQSSKYYYDYIGVNSRLDTLQAAILKIKLNYLDSYIQSRQEVAKQYDDALQDLDWLSIPHRSSASNHIFHQYTIRIKEGKRDQVRQKLIENNIPSMIYYPLPLHLQKAYQYLGYQEGDFPISEVLCKEVLSLPMHTELSSDQLSYIVDCIRSL